MTSRGLSLLFLGMLFGCGVHPAEAPSRATPLIPPRPAPTTNAGCRGSSAEAVFQDWLARKDAALGCIAQFFSNAPDDAAAFVLRLREQSPEETDSANAAFTAVAAAQLSPSKFASSYFSCAELFLLDGNPQRALSTLNYVPSNVDQTRLTKTFLTARAHLDLNERGPALDGLRIVVREDPSAVQAVELLARELGPSEAASFCEELLDGNREAQARTCVATLGLHADGVTETNLRLALRAQKATALPANSAPSRFVDLAARCQAGAPPRVRWYSTTSIEALLGPTPSSPAAYLDAATQASPASRGCFAALGAASCVLRIAHGDHCTPSNAIALYLDGLGREETIAFVRGVLSTKNSFYFSAPPSEELLLMHLALAQAFVKYGSTSLQYTLPSFHLDRAAEMWSKVRTTPFPEEIRAQLFANVKTLLPAASCTFRGSVIANGVVEELDARGLIELKLPVGEHLVRFAGALKCPDSACNLFHTSMERIRHGTTGQIAPSDGACAISFSLLPDAPSD